MRLLMVRYAGDYRDAVQHFSEGGGETYYAQKYSVNAVAEIAKQIEKVTVLCCMTETSYKEVLPNGVCAIGAGFNGKIKAKKLIELIEAQNPTHLTVHTPIPEVFNWAIKNKIKTIAVLADSFLNQGVRRRLRNYQLANLLNNDQIQWVGNHRINSCLSLQKIGVEPKKIIPWDWPALITPDSLSPKNLRVDTSNWNLVYVGSVTESKGVGDLLEAVGKLRAKNLSVSLKIAGKGEIEYFINKAKQLKIADCVEFLGLVQHDTVVPLMREADLVVVPSRHEYPEGFPMTIYEAFCSRTPLVASNHPMFQNNLKHDVNAIIFPASNSTALSESIEKILSDSELYQSLSVASSEACKSLEIPIKWADLINFLIYDSQENQRKLFDYRLSSGYYDLKFV